MQGLSALINWLARALAIAGGIALAVIILVTVTSIIGRALIPLGLRPILGDYEIVEAGTAFAIFCFLPYCQLTRGHAIIDLLTKQMGPTLVRIVDALGEVLMAAALIIIAWRLTYGFLDKFANHETTFIRQFPVWTFYAACLLPSYVAVLAALDTSARAIKSVIIGRDLLPEHQGFE
jgi:TRAP-type C4-dicarboxylate transport system permease small subunit